MKFQITIDTDESATAEDVQVALRDASMHFSRFASHVVALKQGQQFSLQKPILESIPRLRAATLKRIS